jgi:hypothetical protein
MNMKNGKLSLTKGKDNNFSLCELKKESEI